MYNINIKRLKIIILDIFVLLMLIGCKTLYDLVAEPIKKSENELNVWFFLDVIKPNIQIDFLINSDNPIIDFELKNWFFQIGEDIIEFDLNNVHFCGTEIETGYFITLYKNGKYDIESINRWNKEYQNEYEKKSNNFQYKFRLTGYVDRQLSEEIRKNNISYLKAHLEYSFMADNEIIYHTIDEYFTVKVIKWHFTIFDMFNPASY
jgi:hypothetical protein